MVYVSPPTPQVFTCLRSRTVCARMRTSRTGRAQGLVQQGTLSYGALFSRPSGSDASKHRPTVGSQKRARPRLPRHPVSEGRGRESRGAGQRRTALSIRAPAWGPAGRSPGFCCRPQRPGARARGTDSGSSHSPFPEHSGQRWCRGSQEACTSPGSSLREQAQGVTRQKAGVDGAPQVCFWGGVGRAGHRCLGKDGGWG